MFRDSKIKKKISNFTFNGCSIINIVINAHKYNSCPRGEIGSHKELKSRGIHKIVIRK